MRIKHASIYLWIMSLVLAAGMTAFIPQRQAAAKEVGVSLRSSQSVTGSFLPLRARASKVKKRSVRLAWKSVGGAERYAIYGNRCKAKQFKKLISTRKLSGTVKKIGSNKLKRGTYYKFRVDALDQDGQVVASSKVIYAATAGGKAGNAKKVKTAAKKSKVTVKAGKKFSLKAKAATASRRQKIKVYRKIAYATSNAGVAMVSAKGVIKGVARGTCYVYAYAQNGVCAGIQVKVRAVKAPADAVPSGFTGRYQSVGLDGSTYVLKLTGAGIFEMVDIGAGNPCVKGLIVARKNSQYVIDFTDDEDYDPANPLGFKRGESSCAIEFKDKQGSTPQRVIVRSGSKKGIFEREE